MAAALRGLPLPVLVEAASSPSDASSYPTGSFSPVAGELQLICVLSAHATAAETPTGLTGCSLTWAMVPGSERFHGSSGTIRKLSWWWAAGPAPTTGAVTIAFAGTMGACLWNWLRVPAADIANPVVQVAVNGAASGTTINATLANAFEHENNIHIAGVGLNAQATVTPDADFAELGDDNETTLSGTLETQWARNHRLCDPTFAASISGISSLEVRAA